MDARRSANAWARDRLRAAANAANAPAPASAEPAGPASPAAPAAPAPLRTIRGKLVGLVTAAVAAATIVGTTVAVWQEVERYAAAKSDVLVTAARVLASASAPATAANDASEAFEALRAIARMPGVDAVRVETAPGVVLASVGVAVRLDGDPALELDRPAGKGAPASRLTPLALVGARTLEVSVAVVEAGVPVGRLVLIGDVSDLRGRLLSGLWLTLVGAGAALAVGFLVAARLQRRITAPLRDAIETIRAIRDRHDYRARVNTRSDDEVGLLVDDFNAMLGEVAARDDALAAHARGLEAEVAARTRDYRDARDAAEAATRAKSDFLAVMSHEIRTPLNGVLAMAELLAGDPLPAAARRRADVISASGRTLLAVIDDILDLSKIEAGKLELELEAVDVRRTVSHVTALFSARAREKGLSLEAEVAPDTPAVNGDATRLAQVLSNLVGNALKFTETGGVTVRAAPDEAGGVRIEVADTGVGIAADKLETVFEAFSQEDQTTTRRFGGTGLGLAICRRLVSAMDGTVSVRSEPGRGSVFTVRLAAAAGPAAATTDGEGAVAAAPIAAPLCGLFVLVADDGAVNREVAAEALARLGAVARAVTNGAEAVEAVAAARAAGRPFDAVLMDGSMPVLDGFAAARRIRAGEAEAGASRLPVFAFTAHVVGAAAEAWREAGMDGTVHKPFSLATLAAALAPVAEACGAAARPEAQAADDARGDEVVVAAPAEAPQRARAEAAEPDAAAPAAPPATNGAGAGKPAGGPPLLDPALLAQLAEMAGAGRPDFAERVFDLYVRHAPEAVATLRDAAAARDADASGTAAHALKSMSLNMGARRVAAAAAAIERAAREDGLAPTEPALAALERDLAATLEAIAAHRAGDLAPPDAAPVEAEPVPAAPAPPPAAEAELWADDAAFRADLLRGLGAGELLLHYQPLFERRTRAIVGVEALMRWRRHGALVPPGRFIPRAEALGLMGELGSFALRQACRDAVRLPGWTMAVNVAAAQWGAPGFADEVEAVLADTGLEPARLELELTETAFISEGEGVAHTMDRLRSRGIGFSLDDFGTGYASLAYLLRFPVGKIKIDRSFVETVDTQTGAAIVHAVTSIGRSLGMKVVAEGVETEAQARFLQAAGVHALQGFLLGRPMPLEELPGVAAAA